MPTYDELDPILQEWSSDRQIHLFTRYRDEDVRSFEVVGRSGARCQIWIDVRDGVVVHVWDYANRKQALAADSETLKARLDEALELARSWVDG